MRVRHRTQTSEAREKTLHISRLLGWLAHTRKMMCNNLSKHVPHSRVCTSTNRRPDGVSMKAPASAKQPLPHRQHKFVQAQAHGPQNRCCCCCFALAHAQRERRAQSERERARVEHPLHELRANRVYMHRHTHNELSVTLRAFINCVLEGEATRGARRRAYCCSTVKVLVVPAMMVDISRAARQPEWSIS